MTGNNDATSFGSYQLQSKLGEGGMGQVHVAEMVGDAGFRKRVALKRMHHHFQSDQRLLEFFATEARTNARIDHPNVVHVLEFGLEPEPFIAMEFVNGVSLRALLWRFHERGWAIDLRASALIVAEASLGLDYAHRMTDDKGIPLGIVHRDISPSNVLISSEGAVKVSDFGLVMVADNPFTAKNNIPVGKPNYMAPEQAECRPLDARADVFALGLVLWETLTHRQLLPPNDQQAVKQMLTMCNFYPPSRFNPNVPPELDWITMGCLQKDPQARWASAHALSLALRQLLHTRGQGFDKVQLGNLVRGAFPEKGWGPKAPGQPALQPTTSQIAQIPQAQAAIPLPDEDLDTSGPPEDTSPGSPQDFLIDQRQSLQPDDIATDLPPIFGVTVRGRRPDSGSDQFLIAQLERSMWILQSSRPLRDGARLKGPSQGQLLVVVDGMGGRSIGAFGGVVAVDTLAHYAFSVMPWDIPRSEQDAQRLGEGLRAAARACGEQLRAIATLQGPPAKQSEVSMTAAYVLWPDLFVVHTGLTRCSALRGGQLLTITRDQNTNDLNGTNGTNGTNGKDRDDETAGRKPFGRILADRTDPTGESLTVDLHHAELFEGDVLLLNTSALTKHFSRTGIEATLSGLSEHGAEKNVEECAHQLADDASAATGSGVTVVLAQY